MARRGAEGSLSCTTWGNLSFLEAELILKDREFPLLFHPTLPEKDLFYSSGKSATVEEHEDTLWSQICLGLVLSLQSKFTEAETLLRFAIESCKRTLGANHHHTLYGQGRLAWVFEQQGQLDEADEL